MSTYDNPVRIPYQIDAAAIDTANSNLLSVAGPKGMTGRLAGIIAVNTTAVTVAAAAVNVGDGSTDDLYGSLSVPVSAVNTVANDYVDSTTDANQMPADTRVVISLDGGATAGDANLIVLIDWF